MDFSYDPDTDIFYGWFAAAGAAIASTIEVAPGVMLDRDLGGQMIGIEVLNVRQRGAGTYAPPPSWAPARRRDDPPTGEADKGRLAALLELRYRRTGSLEGSATFLHGFVPRGLADRLAQSGDPVTPDALVRWREDYSTGQAEGSEARTAYYAMIRLSNRIARTGELSDIEIAHVLRGLGGETGPAAR